MGETTGIAWTDSTINVWHGCTKVDTLCKHCYAEVSTPIRVKRAKGLEVWGRDGARQETKSWRQDLRRWNRQAEAAALDPDLAGRHHRVFGQSLSDTFEDYRGDAGIIHADGRMEETLDALRADFFAAIEAAPALTFQLLTKRPENILRMVPPSWREYWPTHVWIGTSVGDQESADLRIPHLLRVPAAVRFLSVEPQVGPVDLWGARYDYPNGGKGGAVSSWGGVQWVIQGGESGPKARPFDLAWARSLRDQCRAAGVAYFLKQLGAQPEQSVTEAMAFGSICGLRDSHGGDESEWPADLQNCRAFPEGGPRG